MKLFRTILLAALAIVGFGCQNPSGVSDHESVESSSRAVDGLTQITTPSQLNFVVANGVPVYLKTVSWSTNRQWLYVKTSGDMHPEVGSNWSWAGNGWIVGQNQSGYLFRTADFVSSKLEYSDSVALYCKNPDYVSLVHTDLGKGWFLWPSAGDNGDVFTIVFLPNGEMALWNNLTKQYLEGQPSTWQVGIKPNYTQFRGARWTMYAKSSLLPSFVR